jgi:hypothetical protein
VPELSLVVDAANVVGSRPDGWWRDRAGATRRLAERLAAPATTGLQPGQMPDGLPPGGGDPVHVVLVVEGAARGAVPATPALTVVEAARSGDDEVVRQVLGLSGPVLVVTADRELRARVATHGAALASPRWLLALLDALDPAALPPPPGS